MATDQLPDDDLSLIADAHRWDTTAGRIAMMRAAIAADRARAVPVAWRWVWKSKPNDIDGWCYTNSPPLYPDLQLIEPLVHPAAPSHPAAQGAGEREEWTDVQIEGFVRQAGGRWNGDHWVIEDADLHPMVRSIAARASEPSQADGWQPIDKPPALPDDDSEVPVWTWDGEFVSEDEYGGVWEQPAGPAVGGWVRVGDGFLSDKAGRVTHWRPRVKPKPPAAPAAAQSEVA